MSFISDEALGRLRCAVDLPDLPGTRYRVEERLGAGGMGTVYRARDVELDRAVAIKVATRPPSSDAARERMEREARVIARLEHPGIVPVHEIGKLGDGRVYYVMKLVEGMTLDAWLAGDPALNDRLRMVARLCEIAAFAHARGVVHRDLKPANVMVGSFGEVFVMDWGVARDGDVADAVVAGTPGFMAPEQEGRGRVDHRADIHALGRILEAAAGEPPRRLAAVIARATAAAPSDRYPDALALADDLTRLVDGRPVAAYRENLIERIGRFIDRNRFFVYLMLAYVVLRLLVFFLTRF